MQTSCSWPRLLLCLALGAVFWMSSVPEGLTVTAWRIFSVFVAVVAGFLFRPLPMAPVVLFGLLVLITTGTVSADDIFHSGFGSKTVWLVTSAFLLAGAVEKTGLGRRLALTLMTRLGRSLLGLGYAIALTELLLGPFVPSNTARGGGILSPIVKSLAEALGARPQADHHRAGAFLVQTGAHANLVVSAMFLTAMAGNAALLPLARDRVGVEWSFGLWLLGSVVPGLAGLALVPWTLRRLERPDDRGAERARDELVAELKLLGPWTRQQRTLGVLLTVLFFLWTASSWLGWHPTTIALLGLLGIVLTGTLSWRELMDSRGAWDSLLWLGGFVALAEALKASGFSQWFGQTIGSALPSGPAVILMIGLALVYFLSMYLFSQLTAHIAALAGIFLAVGVDLGAPPYLALALMSYFSCLCGLTTPWSSGPVIIYFGFGYVSVGRWLRNGLLAAVVQVSVWLLLGLLWWRLLGWW